MLLAVGQQLYQKESLALVFFCEVSQITFAGFLKDHLSTTASILRNGVKYQIQSRKFESVTVALF